MKSIRTVRLASCAAIALTCPVSVAAQDSSPAPAAVAPATPDDIIVTARRRAERQQDVPLAVSVVSGAALEQQAITSINDLNGRVPNLTVSAVSGRSAPVFAIRGLSQQDLTALSDPSVSLYMNEIVVPRPLGANLAFFDLASVQVLRGPQGTLFGRNTPGGAVVITPHGAERTFGASLAQTIGNQGTFITDAVLNVPLGDALSVRVAGQHKESDGYIFDVQRSNKAINSINEDVVRVTVDFHPNDRWHNVLSGGYSNADNGGTGSYAIPIGGTTGAVEQLSRDFYHVASGALQYERATVWNVENITTFQVNDRVTLKNIIGYRDLTQGSFVDADGIAAIDLHAQRIGSQHQISEEFQIQGDEEWGNWIAGLYYFQEKADEQARSVGSLAGAPTSLPVSSITQVSDILADPLAGLCRNAAGLTATPVPVLGNPAGCASGFTLWGRYSNTAAAATNTSMAFFLQTSIKLDSVLPGLVGTIGVRQNYDRREAVIKNRFDGPIGGPAAPGHCRFMNATLGDIPYDACALPLKANFREPTYNISLDWHATDDILLYGATRHGYRTGGFGARASTVAGLRRVFQPEKVDDFELGIKADWHPAGMFLRTNLAVFRADYRDIQRLLSDLTTVPVTTVTTNAGKARIQGVELESIFRPADWLELSGSYSYTDAKFTSFIGPDLIDRSSVPFARAPKHIANAAARVFLPIDAAWGQAEIGANWNYQSRYSNGDSFDPRFPAVGQIIYFVKGRQLVNLDAAWNNVMGSNFDISFFMRNVFDKFYELPFTTIALNPATGAGIVSRTPSEPRTFGMRLKYSFGSN